MRGTQLNKGQRTKVYPINTSKNAAPAQPKINYSPPSENPESKKKQNLTGVFIRLTALILVLVLCIFLWVNLNIEYTHNYISVTLPRFSGKSITSELSEAVHEDSVPVIAANSPGFYDYTRPVPKSKPVDSDYFSDTVFIGDSRLKGLLMYTDISPLDFSGEGANVESVQTKSYIRLKDENGEFKTYTLPEALEYKKGSYKSVYISLGLNELGWPLETFMSSLESLVKTIRSVADVPIYLQMIMPMTQRAEDTNRFGLTNAKQRLFNQSLIRYCTKARLFRLDPISLFSLGDGTLDPNHASDGVHLYPASYLILADYYKTHVVNLEMYADTRSKDPIRAPEGVFESADNITPIA